MDNVAKAVASMTVLMTASRDLRKVTAFLDPKLTVVLARPRKPGARDSRRDYSLTIGRPNAVNRERVKTFRQAGEPFPVKKFRLDYFKDKA